MKKILIWIAILAPIIILLLAIPTGSPTFIALPLFFLIAILILIAKSLTYLSALKIHSLITH